MIIIRYSTMKMVVAIRIISLAEYDTDVPSSVQQHQGWYLI